METTGQRGRSQEVVGEVVSDKMDKTISVRVYRKIRHGRYGKYIRKSTVFKAHDENGKAKMGDVVRIFAVRPLSKTKRWALKDIVQSSVVSAEANV
jgi:small subunit ribosomal protein S17